MEKEAAVVVPLHRFYEPYVEQFSPVEGTFATLLNDEDGVLHILLLQKRVHVLEEQRQMFLTIPVRDQNGDELS